MKISSTIILKESELVYVGKDFTLLIFQIFANNNFWTIIGEL